ncbi:hypothetical protein [Mycolicibacterium vulneris]|uniref:hypothetical protein n=1 Tax=Mycolicibacterium vulneris TaxID=547163 RepID=UPI001C65B5F5|nr:hypothetical protein [Mycolicibacterium vulneris]
MPNEVARLQKVSVSQSEVAYARADQHVSEEEPTALTVQKWLKGGGADHVLRLIETAKWIEA